MIYADDTQLYISMNSSDRDQVMKNLEICLQDVNNWMNSNYLVLNDSKMEVLHVSSNFRPCKEISPIMTHSAQVKPSTSV